MNSDDFYRIWQDIASIIEARTHPCQEDRPFDEEPYTSQDNDLRLSAFQTEFDPSIRGLELWVSDNTQRKDAIWEIVQTIVRYQKFANPIVTATIYRNYATAALHEAHMTGLRDEQQAILCRN